MPSRPKTFYEVLTDAINDMVEYGFDDVERLAQWQRALREAALRSMGTTAAVEKKMREAMQAIYSRAIERKGALQDHKDMPAYTLEQIKPRLRLELDRRILASANLIKLNRDEEISKTLRRFSGWATSIPAGGTEAAKKPEVKEDIKKALSSLPFTERRVIIDQGHKLTASLNEIIATDGGAIAAVWRSHYHQPGYDYRTEHKAREIESKKMPYVVRGNWAMEQGLMKLAGSEYTDDMTKPGEEVYCRCSYQYIYSPKRLPKEMLTEKGMAWVKSADLQRAAA